MEKNLAKKTLRNSLWNFSSSLIARVGSLIFTIMLARFLLPESFGIYNLVISIAFIFMTFFHGGMNETFIRYLSEAVGQKSRKKTKSYFRYLLKTKFLISGTISLLLIFLAYPLSYYVFKKPLLFLPLLISAIYIFVFSFEEFFSSVFFALKKIKFLVIKETLSQIIKLIIVFVVFFTIASSYYVLGIIAGLIITSLIVLSFILYYVNRFLPYLFEKVEKINQKDKKRILQFLTYITIGTISFIFFGYVDAIMLGLLIEDAAFIGYYRSAFALVSSLGGLLTFSYVFLPVFIQIKKEKIGDAFNKILKYSMSLAIPATFGIVIFSKYIIRVIYGYEYLAATLPLYFLSSLIIFGVLVTLFLNLFSAMEKPRVYLPLLVIVILLNIALNYILITFLSKYSLIWATTGAGIATIISWGVYSLGLAILSKKVLNIKIQLKPLIKPLIASIIMALILSYTLKYVKDMTLIGGVLWIILGILIYLAVMLAIKGIKKEDLLLFKEIFK